MGGAGTMAEVSEHRPDGHLVRVGPVRWIGPRIRGCWRSSARYGPRSSCPPVFGLTHVLFSNPQVSLFGAFGSFALLLLVDFPGRPRTRLVSYVALFFVGSCFIALGTVVSTYKVAAVVAMAVVGFVVLFAGIVSPQAATASTAALLTFVLAGGRRPAGLGGRPPAARLGARRCVLHPRLHVGLAHALARRPPPAAVGHRVGGRPAGTGVRRRAARS